MIEGYCVPLVASPGDRIEFKVSSSTDYDVTYLRLKMQDDQSVGLPLSEPQRLVGGKQDIPLEPWNGCRWATSFPLDVPLNWRSGMYAAMCTDLGGEKSYIVFIVRPDSAADTSVAVLANTITWNAYDGWGGRSKYGDPPSSLLSFERPFPGTSPVDDGQVNHLTRGELFVLNWLEDSGYNVHVYADTDFHNGIPDLSTYDVLILNTHPEYFTAQMIDHLEAYLAGGGSVAYLGGNGVFELCELHDAVAEFYGGDPSQGRERNFLRNQSPPRPEREILGVAYLFNNFIYNGDRVFCKPAPYAVEMAEHRLFSGTGLRNGDLIGRVGLNRRAGETPEFGAASGWEMDSSDDAAAPQGSTVNAWLSGSPVYGADGSLSYDEAGQVKLGSDRGNHPPNLELLARGTNDPLQGPVSAHMTYYRHPGGGAVFSVGSLTFGGSLAVDSDLQHIVRNMLNEALGRYENANDGVIYAVEPMVEPLVRVEERTGPPTGGRLFWYRHLGTSDGRFAWEGPKTVGKGWDFKQVFAADDRVIYGIDTDGKMIWYRHLGRDDGSFTWQGPKGQRPRWDYRHVFSGGDGVIYAVEHMVEPLVNARGSTGPRAGGRLLWHRHLGWADGSDRWAQAPKTIGQGWDFKHVFSGGDGVIYAINHDGDLVWYRHLGREDGRFVWDGPRTVGHGWDFAQVFSAGDGVIYAVEPMVEPLVRVEERTGPPTGGRLFWYRHLGWADGTDSWAEGPKTVGKGWEFEHVFAQTITADAF